jgi:hypothetical protein
LISFNAAKEDYYKIMDIKFNCLVILLVCYILTSSAQEKTGATIPWTTYEAEQMTTNGAIMGPNYEPYRVETESSGQQCVKLAANGQFVEFTVAEIANSMVIRFSLPDNKEGSGTHATLRIYKNGSFLRDQAVSSRYAWLYGKYPFTNDPTAGSPRHFYDEVRIMGVQLVKGDVIRIQRHDEQNDDANYCIIDLVDLEDVGPALNAPLNSLSVKEKQFQGSDFNGDYTEAFRKCIAKAEVTGQTVWIPAGNYTITGDILLPTNITIKGAGMWYTTLEGDPLLYADENRRVRLKGYGSNIHMADFSIIGKLNYRSDKEANDGIVGSFGENSTISNIWIEHTKVGMWIENSSNLVVSGCRLRNTMADGINFCVGMARSTISNCTTRGTGDDCFAIWPTVFMPQVYAPGHNLIEHCTAQLPYLANGAAIYGGDSNSITDCSFIDISQGSAILISTTFPTANKTINNNFSGTTIIGHCVIKNSGGFDHEWDWRAAIEICMDKRSISGIELKDLDIRNSLSNGLSIIAKNVEGEITTLTNVSLQSVNIIKYGIGVKSGDALFISGDAHGSLLIKNSVIPAIKNESATFTITR